MLATTAEAIRDSSEMIGRLLRPPQELVDMTRRPVALGDVLQQVATLTAPRWCRADHRTEHRIDLRVETSGDTTIDGWPARLREAFTNLVLNAVDALPDGGSIRLSVRAVGARVVAEVADSGVGMTPEVQARIFEPFYTTKGRHHGTGLGMVAVCRIVEEHGGHITVESGWGRGTTFRLSFPASATRRLITHETRRTERYLPWVDPIIA